MIRAVETSWCVAEYLALRLLSRLLGAPSPSPRA
jgi:hypothetical protein